MIKVNQIKLNIDHTKTQLLQEVLKILHVKESDISEWYIDKQSIDARKKPNIYYIYSVCVLLSDEPTFLRKLAKKKNNNIQEIVPKTYHYIPRGETPLEHPPVVIGSGPAGLFCAYELALRGYKPVLLERGAPVEKRIQDVAHFWNTGILNTESNVQFGEGGAGTFSDGKLNTGVKDPFGRNRRVLETLVEHGAPEAILYDSKPHIGTDILVDVVRNLRNHIIALGGTVSFHAKVTGLGIDANTIKNVTVNDTKIIPAHVVVLAIGHSARDTFESLHRAQVPMEAKAFAIGLRVEHPQKTINESQYGNGYAQQLPAAPYKVTANLPSGRGVYSFCMCPGGYVVNASSEPEMLAVNGMSYSKRNSKNANSAIVVTITPEDYKASQEAPLSGMYFQRELEHKAFEAGKGHIPVQLYGDFCKNRPSLCAGNVTPEMKGNFSFTNLRHILPDFVSQSIIDGMQVFGQRIHGFSHPDTLLSGVESRTSSPVRILRNTQCESAIHGLYPCGEGAGYAGGITSAAIDGIKVFEAIGNTYKMTNSL